MSDANASEVELPRAQVKRVVQAALSKLPGANADANNLSISKDALLAFCASAKVLISYVTTTANDLTKEGKRQTISAEDVVKAVEELEFTELVQPLKDYLEGYKKWNKERNQKRAESAKQSKKRKAEEAAAAQGEEAGTAADKGEGEANAPQEQDGDAGAEAAAAAGDEEMAEQAAEEEEEEAAAGADRDEGQKEDEDMS